MQARAHAPRGATALPAHDGSCAVHARRRGPVALEESGRGGVRSVLAHASWPLDQLGGRGMRARPAARWEAAPFVVAVLCNGARADGQNPDRLQWSHVATGTSAGLTGAG